MTSPRRSARPSCAAPADSGRAAPGPATAAPCPPFTAPAPSLTTADRSYRAQLPPIWAAMERGVDAVLAAHNRVDLREAGHAGAAVRLVSGGRASLSISRSGGRAPGRHLRRISPPRGYGISLPSSRRGPGAWAHRGRPRARTTAGPLRWPGHGFAAGATSPRADRGGAPTGDEIRNCRPAVKRSPSLGGSRSAAMAPDRRSSGRPAPRHGSRLPDRMPQD